MTNLTKSLKERTKRLIDLKPYNTIRNNLLLDKAFDELNLMITNETTIFNDIRRNIKLQRKYKPKYSKIFFRQI